MAQTASAEVVERFKQGFEWWNCGEPDLMLDEYAEDGELDLTAVFGDTSVFRGHENMRRQIDEFWEIWEGIRMEPLEIFDIGGGRIVVDLRLWGKGKRSGVEIDQRFAWLYTLRPADNKVVRSQLFPTVQAAMDCAEASAPAATPTDQARPARSRSVDERLERHQHETEHRRRQTRG